MGHDPSKQIQRVENSAKQGRKDREGEVCLKSNDSLQLKVSHLFLICFSFSFYSSWTWCAIMNDVPRSFVYT